MNYILEGTVSELTVAGSGTYKFKVTGAEGYAIKDGEKTYNIFRPENLDMGNDVLALAAIAPEALEMKADGSQIALISSALAGGKRVRVGISSIEVDVLTNINNSTQGESCCQIHPKNNPVPISAITLLAN